MPALSVLFMPALLFSIRALESRKQAVKLGLLLSAMVAWGGFHWIIYVAQNFGQLPLPVAVLLLCLFCFVAAPQILAFLLIGERARFWVERLPLFLRPLFWASLYTGLEFLARFVKIFPEHLGNPLIAFLPLAQAASLGGVSLLSFLALWLGASLAYLRLSGKRALPACAASLLVPVLISVWGTREIDRFRELPTTPFKVGIVQHNLDEVEKLALFSSSREAIDSVIRRLLSFTENLAATRPDLILWPETAYPITFPGRSDTRAGPFASSYADLVKQKVREAGVPLLFGGYETNGERDFNSAILVDGSGVPKTSYRKVVLLMFGEYLPFADWFPSLKQLNPQMGDFARGEGPLPLPFEWKNRKIPLGVNICYEAILPEFMRSLAQNGAKVFVNITKDSWFGDTFEPWQHFQLSALRAVEHRIPMVRITNTGLSGVVLPTGESHLISAPFQEAVETVTVPVTDEIAPTLYSRWGEWFAWLSILSAIGLGALAYRKGRA